MGKLLSWVKRLLFGEPGSFPPPVVSSPGTLEDQEEDPERDPDGMTGKEVAEPEAEPEPAFSEEQDQEAGQEEEGNELARWRRRMLNRLHRIPEKGGGLDEV